MDSGEIIALAGVIIAFISLILEHFWVKSKFNTISNSNNKLNVQKGNNNKNGQ